VIPLPFAWGGKRRRRKTQAGQVVHLLVLYSFFPLSSLPLVFFFFFSDTLLFYISFSCMHALTHTHTLARTTMLGAR